MTPRNSGIFKSTGKSIAQSPLPKTSSSTERKVPVSHKLFNIDETSSSYFFELPLQDIPKWENEKDTLDTFRSDMDDFKRNGRKRDEPGLRVPAGAPRPSQYPTSLYFELPKGQRSDPKSTHRDYHESPPFSRR